MPRRLLALYCEAQIFGWSEPAGRIGGGFSAIAGRLEHGQGLHRVVRPAQTCYGIERRCCKHFALPVRQCATSVEDHPTGDAAQTAHIGALSASSEVQTASKARGIYAERLVTSRERIQWRAEISAEGVPLATAAEMTPQSPPAKAWPVWGLHTNGCGDFTLLSRDDWFRLRGYPEWPIFSWHIDSVLCSRRAPATSRRSSLDAKHRIDHIDHSKGSGWSHDGAAQLFARLDRTACPTSATNSSCASTRICRRPRTQAIINGEDWGLVEYTLAEREVAPP